MRGKQSYIAREARAALLLLLFVALLLFKLVGPIWSLPLWFAAIVLAYLYRDPERRIPPLPMAVISPVDGTVVFVKKGRDPYLDRQAIHIRLKIHRFGIFGLRSPIEGKMLKQWLYQPDQKEKAPHIDQPSAKNHHYVLWVQTDEKDDVVMIIEFPNNWQRPECYLHVGERIGQGQRYGRTSFGGHVELFMPINARLEVNHGDHVKAGAGVLATMIHK